jgi:acetyl esterase/lipase
VTPREYIELPALEPDGRERYGAGPMHAVEFFMPGFAGPHPWVLAVHGGFWRNQRTSGHMSRLCRALAGEGMACCSISYRRVGDEGGGWPNTFQDVLAAADFLQGRAGTVVAVGVSAGGHLLLRLAAERAWLAGAVALAPVADLAGARERNLGDGAVDAFVSPDRMTEADPLAHPPLVPTTVIHGTEDDIVPVELSRGYAATTGVRLIEIAGANHLDLINPQSIAWSVVRDAVRRSSMRETRVPRPR